MHPNWAKSDFYWKWYTGGWVIQQKIGIDKVRFWRFSRHIHIQFWGEYPIRLNRECCFVLLTEINEVETMVRNR